MAKRSKPLIIVGCGKAKIWYKRRDIGKVEAHEAYVGPLFRSARRFAEKHGKDWLILSAKYGLLRPKQPISDYDVTIGSPGAVTTKQLRQQWRRLRNAPLVAVCLASKKYVDLLRASIPEGVSIRTPLEGMDLFERMRWLKRHS